MVIYEGLFDFCLVIIGVIELIWFISNNKRK